MTPWTVDSLIDQGPEFVRDFIRQTHRADEFDPRFSWLLLADSIGLQVSLIRDEDPALAARWAEIAAILYDGLIQGSRPEDDLARSLWAKNAAHDRALAAGSPAPVAGSADAHDPRPV